MDKEFLMGLMEMPEEVVEAILSRHEEAVAAQQEQLRQVKLDGAVALAITAAGGRSRKAIAALLDTAALETAEDPESAAKDAVEQVKRECGYLFAGVPGYAVGTGGTDGGWSEEPMSLAAALKEKFV